MRGYVPIDPNLFWAPSDEEENPPLTDSMIADAERLLQVRLPRQFIDLLRVRNGGTTRGFMFPTQQPTTWAPDHVPLYELSGIGSPEGSEGALTIHDTNYMTHEWDLHERQVLLIGEGHWWITLDYRKGGSPCVTCRDVAHQQGITLARSFREFLDDLLPDSFVDDETGLPKKGGA